MSNNIPDLSSYLSSQTSQSSQNLIPLNSFPAQHQTTTNLFDAMPEELRLKIVDYLPPKDIRNMSLANRRWNLLCNNLLLRRTFTIQGHPRASCFVPKEPNFHKEMYLRCLAEVDNFIDNFSPLSELRGDQEHLYKICKLTPYLAPEIIRRSSNLPIYLRKELITKLHEIFNSMIKNRAISTETVMMLQIPDPESLVVNIDAEDLNKLMQIDLNNISAYSTPNLSLSPYQIPNVLSDSIDAALSIKDHYIRNLALAKIAYGCCNPCVERLGLFKAEEIASAIEDPRIKKDIIKHIASIYIKEKTLGFYCVRESYIMRVVTLLSADKAYYYDTLRDIVAICVDSQMSYLAPKLITMIPVGTAQSLAAYKYLANDLLKREGIRNALEFAEKIPVIYVQDSVIKDIKMWSAVNQQHADDKKQSLALQDLALTNLAEGKFEIAEEIANSIKDVGIKFQVLIQIMKEHLKQENIEKVIEFINHFAEEYYLGRLLSFGILIETILQMTIQTCIAINRLDPDIQQLVLDSKNWNCSKDCLCKVFTVVINEFLKKAKYSLSNADKVIEFAQSAETFIFNFPQDKKMTEQLIELAMLYLQIGMKNKAKKIGEQIDNVSEREKILKKCDECQINNEKTK